MAKYMLYAFTSIALPGLIPEEVKIKVSIKTKYKTTTVQQKEDGYFKIRLQKADNVYYLVYSIITAVVQLHSFFDGRQIVGKLVKNYLTERFASTHFIPLDHDYFANTDFVLTEYDPERQFFSFVHCNIKNPYVQLYQCSTYEPEPKPKATLGSITLECVSVEELLRESDSE